MYFIFTEVFGRFRSDAGASGEESDLAALFMAASARVGALGVLGSGTGSLVPELAA